MAKFLISTTGSQSAVTLSDMGYVFFTHPTVNFDLFSEFDIVEVGSSNSLQSAMTLSYLTATDEYGTPIVSSKDIHIASMSGGTNMMTGGTFNRFSIRLSDDVNIASLTTATLSASTFSASTLFVGGSSISTSGSSFSTISANTIYSGSTNISSLFAGTSHGHAGGLGITIDGARGVISSGQKGYLSIPFSGIMNSWEIYSDVSGSTEVDVWKSTFATFPPTSANTITDSNRIRLTNAREGRSTNLSAWTQSFDTGDVLAFNVISASTVTRLNILISITKYN
jgi:hypothetical protein